MLVVVAGVSLLLLGRYPRGVFDLVIGFNRWIQRVIAYAAFLTDRYPPFRLDQGGAEPGPPVDPTPPIAPDGLVVDLGRDAADDGRELVTSA